jgi:hypothetical protein
MAILPELVIQYVLSKGLRSIREDEYILDTLLYQLPQKSVQEIKKILRKTEINIILGYPREATKLPCISILLRGEDESNSFLGDYIGSGYDPDVPGIPGGCSTSEVASQIKSTIHPEFFYDAEGTDEADPVPDEDESSVLGQPRKIFSKPSSNPSALPNLLIHEGGGFATTCLVQVMTTHPELTLVLAAIIKYSCFRYKMWFEGQYMSNVTLSATDFIPLPEYFPDFVYSRGIQLSFENRFSYFYSKDRSEIPSAFDIRITGKTPNSKCTELEDSEILASPTGVSLVDVDPAALSIGVPVTLTLSGLNIQNGSVAIFDQLTYDSGAGTGIQILAYQYIHGNSLEVGVLAYSAGTTDVTVRNLDYTSSTLANAITVT